MIIALNTLIFILVSYFQASFLYRFDLFGFTPNVILILMVSITLFRENYESYVFAFLAGLTLDSLSGGPFGLYVGTFMLIAFSGSLIFGEDHSKISAPISYVFNAVAVFTFYLALFLFIVFETKDINVAQVVHYLGQVVITVLASFVLIPAFKKLFVWENMTTKVRGK